MGFAPDCVSLLVFKFEIYAEAILRARWLPALETLMFGQIICWDASRFSPTLRRVSRNLVSFSSLMILLCLTVFKLF